MFRLSSASLFLALWLTFPAAAQEIRLSNRFVNDVAVDGDNLVWVATEEGLNLFDGIQTRAFLKHTDGLPANLVNDVLADRTAPRVWAAFQKGGLACYDKREGAFTIYRAGEGPGALSDDDITHLEQGADGSIWASTFTAGIDRLDPDTGTFTRYNAQDFPGYRDAPLHTFALNGDRLILGYWASGVSILSLRDHSRLDLHHDPSDPFSLPSDEVRSLLVDSRGRLWVGTTRGLALYTEADGHFTVFHPGAGALQEEIFDLKEDARGRLLIAAGPGGVAALDIRQAGPLSPDAAFETLVRPERSERTEVRSVEPDRFGNLWIGTYDEGLLFHSGSERGAGRLAASERRDAWFVPGGGAFPASWQGEEVLAWLEDGKACWVGTDKGLYHVDLGTRKVLAHYTSRDPMTDELVRALAKDPAGRLWVGTYGNGLIVFDPQMNQLIRYESASGLGSDTVNHLLCDGRGRIWAATTASLACFPDGPGPAPVLYGVSDGLPDDNIRALATDEQGRLWMSTNSGISCLDADGSIRSFDQRDGLPEGNYYSAAVRTEPSGRILFDSTDGVGWVLPAELLSEKELPPVVFLTPASELSVDYRDNYLHFRFCVPDYAFSSGVEYAYRIEDLDPDWHPCGKELEFSHLPYGKHSLQVRARLHSQQWGEDISSIAFEIRPPFWLSWWAKGLYLLLALCAAAAIGIYLSRRMARRERERLQRERLLQEREAGEERMLFYTNITHELRTPLTLILGPLEDLSADEGLPAPTRGRIRKVKDSARQLLGLVNQILEFRKTETRNRQLQVSYGDFSRCVEEIGSRFRDLSTDKAVSFELSIEPDVRLWFDREAVTIILNNLLSNARKYTPSGKVVLSLRREDGKVAVTVADTGCGIGAEDLKHIFERYYQVKGPHQASGTGVGLALVKNLCDIHHIGLSVSSEPGQGSEFRLLFDPEEDYPEALRIGPAPVEEEPADERAEEEGKIKILVVEDNADIREYIRESLGPDYTVLLAEQGRSALKTAVREIPDIIVSDIMMPVMDGIDLCKAIRQDVRTSHIPVVLLTAKGSDQARQEGYEVGADSYLVKPFNKALLLSRIRNLLERRDRQMRQFARPGETVDLSPVDNVWLDRYTAFVLDHLGDEKIDIASLASEFAMSQSTLYRKVKAVCGLSPNELIRNIRLDKAAELLRNTRLTISEIAWQTGFGSPVYFRTCFKERYAQTPTEFRDTLNQAE